MNKLIDADKLREQMQTLRDSIMKKKSDKNTDSDVYYRGGMLCALEETSNYIDEAPDLSPIDSKELGPDLAPQLGPSLYAAADDSWALYEHDVHPRGLHYTCYRDGFKAGANWQAQHSLTLEDIKRLDALIYAIKNNKTGAFTFTKMSDEKYEEVLKRFNASKVK